MHTAFSAVYLILLLSSARVAPFISLSFKNSFFLASFSLNMVHEIQYEVYFNSERREK